MLEQIRQFFFFRALRRLLAIIQQQRRRRPHNFQSARTVGLLFDATADKNRRDVLDWVASLKKQGKMVRLLGFFDLKKEPPAFAEATAGKPDFDFFTRKDTAWTGKPKGEKATAFAQEKFDLLLSLNPDDLLPLQWLAIQSPAAMKIGMATDRPNDFDLTLETPPAKGIRFFVEQLNHYLDKLVLTKYEPATAL